MATYLRNAVTRSFFITWPLQVAPVAKQPILTGPLVKMLSALTHCKQGRQSATKDLATIPFDLDGIIPRVVGADRASTYAPWADMCTLSTANLALASLWLQNCLRNHTPCANFQGSEGSPIRLLDLQDPKSPLLILTSDTEACDRYVTLSYKWGFDQEPEYRTTRANYKKRTEVGLLTERLPRTFREAIEVTVSLGLRYLWIDALCIIQDDYIDQEQINTMDQVFRNSTLTLFAALGEDPDAGLSVARDSRLSKPCSLNITVSVGEHTRRLASLSAFAPLHGWLSEDMFLLFRRGWALQEQILSPRGLVFGDQLSWRCVCGQHSESEPLYRSVVDDIAVFTRFGDGFDMDSSASRHCSVRYWLVRKDPLVHPSSTLKHIRPQDPFEAWYQIVEMYTLRTLRDGSDILRAIAGLASGLQRLHGGRYLVGLWEDDLQRGLLWYVESISSVESFHERPFARISSWTWVSQWGRNIQYYDGEPREAVHDPSESILIQHHGVHLLDHEFPMDSDNLAEMDHHVLNLRGRVKKATVCAPAVLGKSKSVTWSFPKWPGNVVDAASGSVVGQIALDYELESLVRLRGDSTKTISIYCLLSTVRQKATRWDLTCVGMTYDEEVDEFQRIGLVYISDRTWLGQFSADLKLGATLSEQSGLTRTVRLA